MAAKLSTHPNRLFLIDGIGAMATALCIGIVLIRFREYIGMPLQVLQLLAGIALVFAIYSISCYFLAPRRWHRFLQVIAFANFLYCCTTIALTVHHHETLTLLGWSYFYIEILIIALVIRLEQLAIRNKKTAGIDAV